MENKIGFIPQDVMQPDYYKLVDNYFCACYLGDDGRQYEIQLGGFSDTVELVAEYCECFRSVNGNRHYLVRETFRTVEQAVEYVQNYLNKLC